VIPYIAYHKDMPAPSTHAAGTPRARKTAKTTRPSAKKAKTMSRKTAKSR
jgi:hypothetical protein